MARLAGRVGRLPGLLAAVAALSAAVAGCATAPSGGPPRAAPGGSNQVKAYVQPLPPPGPKSSWSATDVVLGFLHASASYAFDPAAAREYLVPELRKSWHPGRGVAVVGAPTFANLPYNPKESLGGGQSVQQQVVHLTGPQVATLNQTGQYQYAPRNVTTQFLLEKNQNGPWLIENPPQTLMLTESDFEEVYQPRNLFFFARSPGSQPGELVPDPVYAPLQSSSSALNTDLATGLVNGLLKGQGGWLSGATKSAFPRGTRLLKQVTITGKTAQVDLGGEAAHASSVARQQMAEQLLATLSDGQYSQPLANNIQLYINKSPQDIYRAGNLVPPVPSGPVELITGTSSVGELAQLHGAKVQPRLSQTQLGPVTVTAVAASPSQDRPQQVAVAIQNAGGCAVEEQPGGQEAYRTYPLTSSGGQCTSLSYDANGNLWAAAGSGVWVLSPGHSRTAVDMSAMSAAIQPGDQILALQIAPDAVRAALLVSTPGGENNRLLLAAVHFQGSGAVFGPPVTVGTGLSADPQAISWYNPYNLAVLATSVATSGIYEVPLTTGAAQQAPPLLASVPTGVQPLTLTTDGQELVLGTSQGNVFADALSSPEWSIVANGATDPVYPG